MVRYVIRRLLAFIPTLMAVAIVMASLVDLIPGDPVQVMLGDGVIGIPQETISARRRQMGLDRPYHVRLTEWTTNALRGDFGRSFFLEKTVTQIIRERYFVTLNLTLAALAVALAVGLSAGIVASINQGKFADWIVTTSALAWVSLPGFVVALGLMFLFSVNLRLLPIGGFVSFTEDPVEYLRHLALPALTLGLGSSGLVTRFTRTCMLEVLRQDYITTARAKGLVEKVVLVRHALRNALIPIVTVVGLSFGSMLGGAVITEMVFNMHGMGRLILEAVKRRDYPVVQGGVFVVTATYLMVNLLVDLLYAWVDPRIHYE